MNSGSTKDSAISALQSLLRDSANVDPVVFVSNADFTSTSVGDLLRKASPFQTRFLSGDRMTNESSALHEIAQELDFPSPENNWDACSDWLQTMRSPTR